MNLPRVTTGGFGAGFDGLKAGFDGFGFGVDFKATFEEAGFGMDFGATFVVDFIVDFGVDLGADFGADFGAGLETGFGADLAGRRTTKSRLFTVFFVDFVILFPCSDMLYYDFILFAISIISLNWSEINDELPMRRPLIPGIVK